MNELNKRLIVLEGFGLHFQNLMICRPAELLFASGIPVCGFAYSLCQFSDTFNFIWFYPVILLSGWHVLAVNDYFTSGKERGRKSFLQIQIFFPFFILPPILSVILLDNLPLLTVMTITVLNWDLYSMFGKKGWFSGILHNFIAGGIHFILGATAVSNPGMIGIWPEALFFSLAMTGAAMHHDASHFSEDMGNGYRTGAVMFGYEKWWRMALIPMLFSIFPLYFATNLFCLVFGIALSLYFISYFLFLFVFPGRHLRLFRSICRGIFSLAALAYISKLMINLY